MENDPLNRQDNLKSYLQRQLDLPREKARSLGHETLDILTLGFYVTPGENKVEIQNPIRESVEGTVTYSPDKQLPEELHLAKETRIEVRNETTLNAVKRLISLGYDDPVALNFASAGSPGGGFLNGARAQEEYLARSSALYGCLQNNPMYRYHQSLRDPFYSDYVIYSPRVVIIRDDDGNL
jgi:uncharacterized protein (TIGR02452 family)